MNRIVQDWIANLPRLGDRFLEFLAYVGGSAWGGLFAPAVYFWLLWHSWDAPEMTSRWQALFAVLGTVLFVACVFYPAAYRHYFSKLANAVRKVSTDLDALRQKKSIGQGITLEDLNAINRGLERLLQRVG